MTAMTTSERFHAAFAGREVDRLPIVEWACFWDRTVERWEDEGMPRRRNPDGSINSWALTDAFGLDLWAQVWTSAVHPDCPFKPPVHGAGILGQAGSFDAVEPYIGTWPLDHRHWDAVFSRQRAGTAAAWLTLPGFFWGARDILGIERHLFAFADEGELLHRINSRLAEWMVDYLRRLDALGRVDFVTFAEDLSYNHGAMLSKRAFNTFLRPYYDRIVPELKERGIRIVVDSDGRLSDCAAWFAEAGIEGLLPLERQAGNDIAALQDRHPALTFIGHFDKMVMPHGRAAMQAEWERLLPAMRRGRFLPSVDHQTPPGVSYRQYLDYLELFRQMAGAVR